MISLEAYSELLEVLYTAPLDQEQWQRFLTLVCKHTESKNGLFFCADSRRGLTVRAMGGSQQDVDVATEYNERYGNSDPFRVALIRNARVGVFQGEDLLPGEGLLRTTMYREFVCRLGVRYATVVPLTLSVRQFEAISVWRTLEAGPMDDDCNRLLRLLVPHIQQALEIHRILGVTQRRLAGAEAIADASSTATYLLTCQGQLVHSNAAGDVLLARGSPLALVNETLVATWPESRGGLRAMYRKAAAPDFAHSKRPPTHAFSLPRAGGARPLQMLASPLPQALRARTGAEIVVLVTDPDSASSFPDSVLRTLYGLTAAEIELANGLLMGYSLDEIASLRHVKLGTVRVQMKSLLGKTATSRQSDLVRLLMTLPQPPSGFSPE
jgi:DNA-binding CsgD family transcriptional regulator